MYSCYKFKNLQFHEKREFVQTNRLCYNCLGSKHRVDQCKTRCCVLCSQRHPTLLHPPNLNNLYHTNTSGSRSSNSHHEQQFVPQNANVQNVPGSGQSKQRNQYISNNQFTPQSSQSITVHPHVQEERQIAQTNLSQPPSSLTMSALCRENPHVLLATAQVLLYTAQGKPIIAKALLDNGFQNTFITNKLVHILGYKPYYSPLRISGITQFSTSCNSMVNVNVFSTVHPQKYFKISCAILP